MGRLVVDSGWLIVDSGLTYVGELPESLVALAGEGVVATAGDQKREGGFFSVVPAS